MFSSIRIWVRGIIPRTLEAVKDYLDTVDPVFAFVVVTSILVVLLTLLFPNLCTHLYEGGETRMNPNW